MNLSLLIQEGYKARPQGAVSVIFLIFALATVAFCIWLSLWGKLIPYAYSVIFFALTVPMAFLIIRATPKPRPNPQWFDWVGAALTFGSAMYLVYRMDWIVQRVAAFDPITAADKTAAVICVLGVLELCRRALGLGFTLLILLAIAYTMWGHLLPGLFYHRPFSLQMFLDDLVYTPNGVFGSPIAIVVSIAFLFVTFGVLFQRAGGGKFIFDLAALVAGKQIGGQAKVAVVASGAFGTISGSPAADVAATGSVTIPVMIKSGYSRVFAGGVESAASTGGALLPPIMGTAAFLMVEFTGISYATICISALLCGLLYYYVLFMQVHYRSKKENLQKMKAEELPKLSAVWKGCLYIVPVALIVYIVFSGFTPSRAAIFGIVGTIVVSWIYWSNRITLKQVLEAASEILYSVVPLVVACAAAGILISAINLTGLVGKFTSLIFAVAGESTLAVLIISAIVSILLGMGMPTPAVYVLTATLTAPAIIEMGVPVLAAHLFLIFFASMSAITPPVGVAAYTASGIAEASPLKIGAAATKLAIAAFLLPFMFVFQPALLLQGSFIEIVMAIIFALIGLWALAIGFEGYWIRSLSPWMRVLLIGAGVLVTYPEWISTVIGAVIILAVLLMERSFARKSGFAKTI
jgi:TRAP transporter 4TM/12TM fusion protein